MRPETLSKEMLSKEPGQEDAVTNSGGITNHSDVLVCPPSSGGITNHSDVLVRPLVIATLMCLLLPRNPTAPSGFKQTYY